MIGGVQNAAWLNHDLDDDYLYDMYEGSDSDEYSYDGDNNRIISTNIVGTCI